MKRITKDDIFTGCLEVDSGRHGWPLYVEVPRLREVLEDLLHRGTEKTDKLYGWVSTKNIENAFQEVLKK